MITAPGGRDPWDDVPGLDLPSGVPAAEMTASPGGARAGTDDRESILLTAANITTWRDDATAVAINASALLSWVEAAPDRDDLAIRIRAMEKHRASRIARRIEDADIASDDPEEFLRGARTLYAFMTATSPGARQDVTP